MKAQDEQMEMLFGQIQLRQKEKFLWLLMASSNGNVDGRNQIQHVDFLESIRFYILQTTYG